MRRERYGSNGRGGGGDGGGRCEEVEDNLQLRYNKFHTHKS
jgi:hypothetical protein